MIDWAKIDTVFLDMDGTLLDLHFDNHFWLEHVPMRFAERNGMSVVQAEQHLFPKMHALRGQLDWYCTDFWTQELSLPIIELKREVGHLIQVRAQVVAFLENVRKADKALVLFTNAHEDTVALKMQKTNLSAAFDKVISSHELGVAKEVKGVWDRLGERYEFEAERSLFIDDNFGVLDCAHEFGIQYLFGIVQPDSHGKALSHDHYTLLDSFKQIMPG